MRLKLILKDRTEIDLTEAGLSQHYVLKCESFAEFNDIVDTLTEENLSEISLIVGDEVIQTIEGSVLSGTQTVVNPDKSLTCHIYLRDGVYVQQDAEYSEAGKILLGEV